MFISTFSVSVWDLQSQRWRRNEVIMKAESFPEIIPTEELSLQQIPCENSDWNKVAKFALTFDPRETPHYGKLANDLKNVNESSTLAELRCHLFVEQRRWNHFGREPDPESLKKIRKILAMMRNRFRTEH